MCILPASVSVTTSQLMAAVGRYRQCAVLLKIFRARNELETQKNESEERKEPETGRSYRVVRDINYG